jgi:hypothetical protein
VTSQGALYTLLQHVRRRYFGHLLLEQAVAATAVCLGTLTVLLLVGTQVLDWYWLAVAFGGAFAFGFWRVWRRRLSDYRLAQRVDAGLNTHDTLSTAFFYASDECGRRAEPAVRALQWETAERAASEVDVNSVLPLETPRMLWTAVALAGVAASLLVVRYGMERRLDLGKPIVALHLGAFFTPKAREIAEAKPKSPIQKYLDEQMKALGMNTQNLPAEGELPPDFPMTKINAPEQGEVTRKADAQGSQQRVAEPTKDESADEQGESASPSDKQDGREGNSDSNSASPPGTPQKQPPNKQGGEQRQKGENSSLMDKMRDAMANLMAKLKIPQQSGGEKQGNSQQQSNQAANQQGQTKQGMPNGKQQADYNQGDQQSESQGEGNERAEAQGKQGDKNSDKPGQQDSKSGIGHSDGDKDVREAEQLAAMGKISELIGKRSQNVSGEVTVEVQSNKQQALKTPYSHRTGAHLETGGESHRDEIPLAYERYVQQYFEQVHKAGAAAATGAAKGGKTAQ